MKRTLFALTGALLLLAVLSLAQFLPEEISEWAKWEDFLANANIVAEEQMVGRESVTSPWRLTLEKDGIKRDALWKNVQGRVAGYMDNWRWEVAAYRMDKILGLNMVPPTVERRVHGDRGSTQLWIESEMSLKQKEERKIKTPSYKIFYWNRALYLQRFFDNLIANEDRHQNNYRITKDWRLLLIDHSRSFRSSGKFVKELLYTEKHREGPMEMREIPRTLVEKIKALTFEGLKAEMADYLTDDEIKAVLVRRDLMLKELDKLVQKYGEDKVYY